MPNCLAARFVLAASGHVAGGSNPPARNERSHWLNDRLASNSWLDKAEEKSGCWWPDWDAWMKRHSSGISPASTQPGNVRYQSIEPAARPVCEAEIQLMRLCELEYFRKSIHMCIN